MANSEEMITFAPDVEPQKLLMTRHRVVFDAIYSRTTRLVRFLIRNPQKAQSPELPLYKDILRILAKLRKKTKQQIYYRKRIVKTARRLYYNEITMKKLCYTRYRTVYNAVFQLFNL